MELAKSWFVRKNVKKIQEKFLLLKSFYYICTRGLLKYRAPVWTTDLHFPLRAKHVLHSWTIKNTVFQSCLADLHHIVHFPFLANLSLHWGT